MAGTGGFIYTYILIYVPVHIYPNPAAVVINFALDLDKNVEVQLRIYNSVGEKVADLHQQLSAGEILTWNCRNMASGIYICRIFINGAYYSTIRAAIIK